jgi:hypothetical protein
MKILKVSVFALAFGAIAGGPVFAQGNTSGPAAGSHVDPSTSVQKQNPHNDTVDTDTEDSSVAAGSPGIEGSPGTQSGEPATQPK